MSLFMCATEEMATQQDPKQLVVLMALSLALAGTWSPHSYFSDNAIAPSHDGGGGASIKARTS